MMRTTLSLTNILVCRLQLRNIITSLCDAKIQSIVVILCDKPKSYFTTRYLHVVRVEIYYPQLLLMCSLIVYSCIMSSLLTDCCANELTLLRARANIVQY